MTYFNINLYLETYGDLLSDHHVQISYSQMYISTMKAIRQTLKNDGDPASHPTLVNREN